MSLNLEYLYPAPFWKEFLESGLETKLSGTFDRRYPRWELVSWPGERCGLERRQWTWSEVGGFRIRYGGRVARNCWQIIWEQ